MKSESERHEDCANKGELMIIDDTSILATIDRIPCKDIIDVRICVAQGQQQGTVLKRDLIEFSNLLSSDYAPIQSVQQCRCLTAFKCQMPNACNLPKFAY